MKIYNVSFQIENDPSFYDIHIILEKVRKEESYYVTWDYKTPTYDPAAIKVIDDPNAENAMVTYIKDQVMEIFGKSVAYIEWCEIAFKHMHGYDTENAGHYGEQLHR